MAWQIDPAHSQIQFSVRHMMISNVRGRFETFAGTVDFDEAKPERTQVDIRVQADSIYTKEPQRDGHLKSADFLDAEKYPELRFVSKRVEGIKGNHAKLVGDLTIRDVTNEVELGIEYSGQAKSPWGTVSAGFEASGKINRKDWGLVWNGALETGGVLVGDEVGISVELEMVKQA